MEENINYKKVFIKTDQDLPKEAGNYFFGYKNPNSFDSCPLGAVHYYSSYGDHIFWVKNIDWYLQPIEPQVQPDEEKQGAEEILAYYKNHFRIISNWCITLDAHPKGKYTDRVNWNNKTKVANIFPLTKDMDFENYIFHEVLHICQAELNRGSTKERRGKEEIFVVDLCRLKEYASQPKINVSDEEIRKFYECHAHAECHIEGATAMRDKLQSKQVK